jgi:two-component system cell cycle response regulator DivK
VKQLRALVIDDDILLGQLFGVALSKIGFTVDYVSDGSNAMPTIEIVKPHLITLDVNMPHVSGIEVLHAIRSNPATAQIRVMLVTANRVVTMDDEAAQLADLVVLKPVDLRQFLEFAQRLTEQAEED